MKTTEKFDELKRATLINTDTWEDTYYRFKLWEKGDMKRVYVNYGNKQKSKRDIGYIDAKTGEFYGQENGECMKMVERFRNEYMVEEDQEEIKMTTKTFYEIEEEKVAYDSLRKNWFNAGDGWVRDRFEDLTVAKKEFADACDRYDGDKTIAINLNKIVVKYDEDGDEVDTEYIDCIERFTFDDYRQALKNKMSLESDEKLRWDWEHFPGLECELADELLTERLGEGWND